MAALQAHLERLRVPLPALQQAAVTGVFDAIARTPGLAPAARQDAVSQCLQCGHPAAVEAAVQALSQTETKQLGAPPQDLLLAALAVAPAATAPPLANGLLQLFARQVAADSGPTGAAAASAAAWRVHLLSKALLANPAAAQPLLLGVTRLLSKAADSADGASPDGTLAALQPFLSLVLLDPALQQQHPALAPQLHGALARLVCCILSATAQPALLHLLVSHLSALRLQGADSQAAASAAVGDVMDALESCAEEPDAHTIEALAAGLVCLCHEAAAHVAFGSNKDVKQSAAATGTGGGGGRAAREQQQLDSGTLLVLCALLQQPDKAVARAVLRATAAAVEAAPLLGLTLLPLLLHQLQGQVKLFLLGKHQRPSRLLLELLRALPAMGRHPAMLPFVLRTLQQLLSPDAPEALQAAGLRLMSRLWQASGGRTYPWLRAAVIGFAAPGQQPGLALRAARAKCLRDICLADPDRAVELVGLLQECLCDEGPAVQAIALDCIALLCEADVLEFYAAWRLVHRQLPRLPDHPTAAAAWVRLLGSGGLDAAVQPDAAAAIIDALWLAAGHEAAQVRRQAYASLAAFSFETQEEIGALRPLWHFAALLRREQQQQRLGAGVPGPGSSRKRKQLRQAAAECEALVQAALAHEHATRRRAVAAGPTAGGSAAVRERGSAASSAGSGGTAALSHRLQSVLPKQLLGGSSACAAELLQRLPEVPVPAVLFFYAPPPPPANANKAVTAVAARQAAADYRAVFQEVLRQPPVAAAAAEDAGAAAEALSAWTAFMRRWLAAERAANKQQEADAQQAATDAALRVWQALQEALQSGNSTPAGAASAAWAAAALCCCTPQPLPQLVTAVHTALLCIATGQGQPAAAVQRAALAALGSIAEAVRVAMGISAAQHLVKLLQGRLEQQQAAPADVAAAATGLGLSSRALGSGGSGLPPAGRELLRHRLAALLQILSAAWPAASTAIAAAAAVDGTGSAFPAGSSCY
ncbi:hypothetical protein ABPG75_003637 [Micractinium tetrahymenae]